MNRATARRQVLMYLIAHLESEQTCIDLKDSASDADFNRLCDAEKYWAKAFARVLDEEDRKRISKATRVARRE